MYIGVSASQSSHQLDQYVSQRTICTSPPSSYLHLNQAMYLHSLAEPCSVFLVVSVAPAWAYMDPCNANVDINKSHQAMYYTIKIITRTGGLPLSTSHIVADGSGGGSYIVNWRWMSIILIKMLILADFICVYTTSVQNTSTIVIGWYRLLTTKSYNSWQKRAVGGRQIGVVYIN